MKHDWDYNDDICKICGIPIAKWIMDNKPDCKPYAPVGSSKGQPCCGKVGTDVWHVGESQWVCSQCGAPKSNDPHYLYGYEGERIGGRVKYTGCEHSWKQYTGLRETFEYCEKCNDKRG